jgi:hypothetical protein
MMFERSGHLFDHTSASPKRGPDYQCDEKNRREVHERGRHEYTRRLLKSCTKPLTERYDHEQQADKRRGGLSDRAVKIVPSSEHAFANPSFPTLRPKAI